MFTCVNEKHFLYMPVNVLDKYIKYYAWRYVVYIRILFRLFCKLISEKERECLLLLLSLHRNVISTVVDYDIYTTAKARSSSSSSINIIASIKNDDRNKKKTNTPSLDLTSKICVFVEIYRMTRRKTNLDVLISFFIRMNAMTKRSMEKVILFLCFFFSFKFFMWATWWWWWWW